MLSVSTDLEGESWCWFWGELRLPQTFPWYISFMFKGMVSMKSRSECAISVPGDFPLTFKRARIMQASGMLMGKEPWLTSNHVCKRFSSPLMPKHSSIVKWRNLDFSTVYCPSQFFTLLKCLSKSTARNLGYIHMEFWESETEREESSLLLKVIFATGIFFSSQFRIGGFGGWGVEE